ncbi:MAG: glycosyltransferase family 4 protein [Bacteroidales bacterium]|nr:glycosyltransferase family 4 protein [Bacteroidales bacterium]
MKSKDKIKIRFFIPTLANSAGMERISTGLVRILVKSGFDCGFIVKDSDTTSFFQLPTGVEVKSLNTDGNIKKVRYKAAKALRKYLKEERPDVLVNVDVSMIQISALSCHWFYGVKQITWEQFSAGAINTMAKRLQRYLAAIVSKKMVVLTNADKEKYPSFLRKRVEVIGNFTQINPNDIHSSLTNKIVLSVGRMAKEKGFDILIKSWKYVKQQNPDWKLRIVGGGKKDYVEMLQGIVDENQLSDVVSIIPPVSNIEVEYENASIYVLPSRHEPFGLVLIEAKSFGLPIVSFDCPYGPKEIVKDGVDGFLIENLNEEKMADGINILIEDEYKRKSFAIKAIEDYQENWTENKVEKKWVDIFKMCI